MGALFYCFAPQHTFFLPDLILVLGITALFYRIARRFISPLETVLLIAVFIGCYAGLLSGSLVEPWNTAPTSYSPTRLFGWSSSLNQTKSAFLLWLYALA